MGHGIKYNYVFHKMFYDYHSQNGRWELQDFYFKGSVFIIFNSASTVLHVQTDK